MPKKRIRGPLNLLGVLALATCGGEPPTDPGPPVPSALAHVSGNSQTGVAGVALADRLFVVVTSAQGQGVPAVRVQWAVTAGSGSLSSGATDTDAQGRASVVWTLGRVAGAAQTVSASVAGLSGSPVSFSATAIPGPPAKLAASAGDSQVATVNTLLPVNPAVLVRDTYDNPVPNAAVTFAVASGGGTATGSSATTSAAGVATVGTWKLGTTAGANTLTATVGAVAPLTLFARGTADLPRSVTISAGNSQSAVAGQTVTVAPAVVVRDSFGNAVPGVTVTFAVATGGGSVTGGTATTDSTGTARVTSWRLGTTAGANTLTATVSGVTPATFTAQGLAGSPALLTASAGDAQSATVGTAVATAPAVRVADSNNNPIFGVSVTFAIGIGGGTATGTTASTDSSGIARVASWTLGTASGANTLTATVATLPVLTLTATATPDVPASAGVNGGDGQSATVNTSVAATPSVLVKDQYQNPVPGVSVSFTVAAGGGSVSGASATTDAAGVAAAGGWQLGVVSGTNTLTGSVAGLPAVTFTATATPDVAASAVLLSGDGQSATVGTAVAVAPAVLVRDQYGNPVPAVTVTFAVVSGGGSVSGGANQTDASGVASVISWSLGPLTGANQLTATVAGLDGSIAFIAQGTVGAPTSVTVLLGNNQSATVGGAVPVSPAAVVRDANGNPVEGVTVTFAATGGGSVTGGVAATGADGVATVGSWTLGTLVGLNTLTATAGGLAAAVFTATAVVGPAASVSVSDGDNQIAVAGSLLGTQPAVLVSDQFGNPVPGVSITFAVASGGGVPTGESAATGLLGVGRVGSWRLGTVVGTNTLTAVVPGFAPLTFTAIGTPGPPASLTVSAGDAQTAIAGSAVAVAPEVRVRDANSNVVPGTSVSFAVASGGGALTGASPVTGAGGTAAVGSWALGAAAGLNTLTATVGGLPPVTFTATGLPGSPSTVAIAAGNNQSATVNTAVAVPPSVVVRDANGNPVSGVSVTFAVTGGNGGIVGAAATTGADGTAQVGSWTLGTAAGANALTATVSGLAAATFTAVGLVGLPATMVVSGGDNQNAIAGSAVSAAPSVLIRDAYLNPVAGVGVTFGVTGGGGVASGSSAVTNGSGVAAVGSWTLGALVGTNTLTAAASGLPDVTFTATGLVGPAVSAAINAGDNQAAQVGNAVVVAPAVLVRDANGNPVPSVSVTFAIGSGSGTIIGAATVSTNSSGVATVGGWTLGGAPGANTLTASAAGVPTGVTFNATATAGPPSQVEVLAGNGQSAVVGTAVSTAPRARVRDSLGNPLVGVSVAFAAVSGGGSVTGETGITDAAGEAAAGSWTLGTAVGTNTLTASVAGLSPAVFSATATVGPAASTTINAGNNQSAVAGAAVAVDPAVVVRDQFGNAVSGVSVTFTVASGAGSVSGSPVITDASGIARVASWTLGISAGTNTLTVTSGSLTPLTFTATGIPGVPTSIVVGAGDNQSAVAGSAVATPPAVIARDANGNVVPGVSVTFSVTAGAGAVTGGSVTTDAGGLATVGGWTLGTIAGANQLTSTVGGLAPVTFSATGVAGAPASVAVSSGNNQTATAGSTLSTSPAALVRDINGNSVSGANVSWEATAGGGSVTAGLTSTNASGIASTGWTLGPLAGANTLTATVAGLPAATFTATGTPGSPATLTISAGNEQSATVGAAVAIAPAVTVRDANGNVVPGIDVTFQVVSGGGVVLGASQTTGAGGLATSGGWTLGTTAGANTLTATVTGLPAATFSATALVGPAASMAVSAGDNQTATVNTATAAPPSVVVRDAFGNLVAGVVVAFAASAGGGSVSATLDTTDAAGVASASSWTLGTVAGVNTVSASATGLILATFSATGTAGAAASVGINTGNNQIGIYNEPLPITPTVVVRDAFGNPVAGAVVAFTVGLGGGQFSGVPPFLTNASGVASVGSWTMGRVQGPNTLVATVTGLTAVTFSASAATGGLHSCAAQPAATLCWGFNNSGQLGDGTLTSRLVPTPVSGELVVSAVTTSGQHSCGLTTAGAAYCWGNNFHSQLGDGTTTKRLSPVPVLGGLAFSRIAAGFFHTCAVAVSGLAYCWGRNQVGQLGDSSVSTRAEPVPVFGGLTFVDIVAGFGHSCGLTAAGTVYCWGFNRQGQLGISVSTASTTPTPVASPLPFVGLAAGGAHTCAVTAAGAAYCWGFNAFGQLGDNTLTARSTPAAVSGTISFVSINAGFHTTCGETATGEGYCWGRNDVGQVGDGSTAERRVPTPVAGGLSFSAMTVQAFHACGISTGGSVYCWGGNAFGQLGDGTFIDRLTPVLIVP